MGGLTMSPNQIRRFEIVATGAGWSHTSTLIGKRREVVLARFLAALEEHQQATVSTVSIIREF